jgi:hypothetical protein
MKPRLDAIAGRQHARPMPCTPPLPATPVHAARCLRAVGDAGLRTTDTMTGTGRCGRVLAVMFASS